MNDSYKILLYNVEYNSSTELLEYRVISLVSKINHTYIYVSHVAKISISSVKAVQSRAHILISLLLNQRNDKKRNSNNKIINNSLFNFHRIMKTKYYK